jgi:electron transfer flavoprotein alpha subunit
MKILLIAEHDNKKLKSATYHAITAANELNSGIDVLVIGFECEEVAMEAKEYEHQLAENCAEIITELGRNYNVIISAASTFGKNMMPRVAGLLDVGMVSDIVKIISADIFVRPIYAGNALATVQSLDEIKVLTVRTTAFKLAQSVEDSDAVIEVIQKNIPNTLSEFISRELTKSARPELTNARIVVSGGRGLKSAENFKLLEELADSLGAALGASRAAVDAGFAPNDYQVGQTGKIVAPDLYIAIGISGAIQHLAGMKDSKVIVAINNDAEAPIFEVADYGLVADLFTALTELKTELG